MKSQSTVIRLSGVNVFQQDELILKNIALEVTRGEFLYIVGETGSGKSSLFKILYGELPLKTGSAIIAGMDLLGLKFKQIPVLRRKLGIVFQDFQLLTDRNIYENLHFVLESTGWKKDAEKKARIVEVMEQVGLGPKLYKMPHQLSGGEQQRVVIARALLNRPDIILADEPTGHLDPKTSGEIVKLLQEIADEGTAVLMATHDQDVIRKHPARIVLCQNGELQDVSSAEALTS